ncbi:MAG: hypothetical protein WCH65_04575 [bacterium]
MKTENKKENNDSATKKVVEKIPIFKPVGRYYFELPKEILSVEMCSNIEGTIKQYVLTLGGKKVWWDGRNEEKIIAFLSPGFNNDLDPINKEQVGEFMKAINKIH